MARIDALFAVRADVAAAFRTELQTEWAGVVVSNYLARVPYRLASGTPGQATHYVAHGRIPEGAIDRVVQALARATQGVRTSADWQGKAQGGSLADASWAIAYDGTDILAAVRRTAIDASYSVQPRDVLESVGLVPISQDADDGIP